MPDLMSPPYPEKKPTKKDLLEHQMQMQELQMLGGALSGYPAPEPPVEVDDQSIQREQPSVPYDPTPNTPYSNVDHILALASNAGRSFVPGGNRLTSNLQSYFSGTDDADERWARMNESDDALMSEYPIQTIASNMAGLAVPVAGAVGAVGKIANASKYYPYVSNALMSLPGVVGMGAGISATDDMLDRPEDGNPGVSAVIGGLTGGIVKGAGQAAPILRRKLAPNYWEREADLGEKLQKMNQARRHKDLMQAASQPEIQAPPLASSPNPVLASPQSSSTAQSMPSHQTALPQSPAPAQPAQPGVVGVVSPSGQSSPAATQAVKPWSAPQYQSSPLPSPPNKSPTYTKKHSNAALEKIQEFADINPREMSEQEATQIAQGLQGMFKNMGMSVPGLENVKSRLSQTVSILKELKKSGADVTDPKIVSLAFGRSNTLAVPAAIGAAGVASNPDVQDLLAP